MGVIHRVAAIIKNSEGQFLLCKRSLEKKIAPGMWHMPGGGIDGGETVEQAIIREIKEELNLTVTSAVASGLTHDYADGSHLTFMRVEATGDIVLNEENTDYIWLHPNEFHTIMSDARLELNLRAASI